MRRPGAVRMCMTWPRSARRSRWMGRSIGTGERGFTLLELMSIVTIVGILVTMAVPSYRQSVVKAREAVLMRDLFTIRDLLDQHRADKRSEEHTSELQSPCNLVCRLLLEKKKKTNCVLQTAVSMVGSESIVTL